METHTVTTKTDVMLQHIPGLQTCTLLTFIVCIWFVFHHSATHVEHCFYLLICCVFIFFCFLP